MATRKIRQTREVRAEDAREDTKRVPLYKQRNIMTVSDRTGYVRRWVNDIPGRIEKFLKAGWTVVEDHEQVGDPSVEKRNVSLGSGSRMHVGNDRLRNKPVQAILMEIRKEYYDEDRRYHDAKVDEADASMRRNVEKLKDDTEAYYGDVKISK